MLILLISYKNVFGNQSVQEKSFLSFEDACELILDKKSVVSQRPFFRDAQTVA